MGPRTIAMTSEDLTLIVANGLVIAIGIALTILFA